MKRMSSERAFWCCQKRCYICCPVRILTSISLLVVLTLCIGHSAFAQKGKAPAILKYIEKYKDAALEEMFEYGIPASITLAQGILESGCGTSNLARKSNNHFGIKCATWDGPTSYRWDDGGNACFRSYDDVCDSYRDHSYFLKYRERYEFLFNLSSKDYKGWAFGLKKAGYATAGDYAWQVIKLIQDYELYKFDMSKDEIDAFIAKAKENTKNALLPSSADIKARSESIILYE